MDTPTCKKNVAGSQRVSGEAQGCRLSYLRNTFRYEQSASNTFRGHDRNPVWNVVEGMQLRTERPGLGMQYTFVTQDADCGLTPAVIRHTPASLGSL
jgi:hypothetical protein